jgi:hypothetical protein
MRILVFAAALLGLFAPGVLWGQSVSSALLLALSKQDQTLSIVTQRACA